MTGELISLFDQHDRVGRRRRGQPAASRYRRRRAGRHRPDQAAYHGLPGAIVAKIAPHTEADPVAILAQLLVCCGALIGRGAYFQVEATRHHPNEFVVLVGDSAQGPQGQLVRSRRPAAQPRPTRRSRHGSRPAYPAARD